MGPITQKERLQRHREGLLTFIPQFNKAFYKRLGQYLPVGRLRLIGNCIGEISKEHIEVALSKPSIYPQAKYNPNSKVQGYLGELKVAELEKIKTEIDDELRVLDESVSRYFRRNHSKKIFNDTSWQHYYGKSGAASMMLFRILSKNIETHLKQRQAQQ